MNPFSNFRVFSRVSRALPKGQSGRFAYTQEAKAGAFAGGGPSQSFSDTSSSMFRSISSFLPSSGNAQTFGAVHVNAKNARRNTSVDVLRRTRRNAHTIRGAAPGVSHRTSRRGARPYHASAPPNQIVKSKASSPKRCRYDGDRNANRKRRNFAKQVSAYKTNY